jgi:hypothetical protein
LAKEKRLKEHCSSCSNPFGTQQVAEWVGQGENYFKLEGWPPARIYVHLHLSDAAAISMDSFCPKAQDHGRQPDRRPP